MQHQPRGSGSLYADELLALAAQAALQSFFPCEVCEWACPEKPLGHCPSTVNCCTEHVLPAPELQQ